MSIDVSLSPPTPQAPAIRVLLVDDHDLVRGAIRHLLVSCGDIDVVAEASEGVGAILAARHHRPDVVVMDVSMPGLRGIEATRRVLAASPHTKVIGLSMHPRDVTAAAMLEAGAVAYLEKDCDAAQLCEVIRGASASDVTPTQKHGTDDGPGFACRWGA